MGIRDEIKTNTTQKKGKSWKFRLLMVLLLAAISATAYRRRNGKQAAEHGSAEEAHIVGFENLIQSISGEGKIVGNDLVDIGFDTSGKLTEVLVKPGDIIQQGDLLGRIDNSQYLNNVSRAKNGLAQAQARLAEAQNPLSGTEQSQLSKQGELDYINYQEQILKLENELATAEQSLKTLDISQYEKEALLNNAVITTENAARAAVLGYKEQIKKLELELLRLDNAVAASDRALITLDQDIVEANITDDLVLIDNEDQARDEQMLADIENTTLEIDRVLGDIMQQVDLILGISPTYRSINDSYETSIGAKDTGQKRDTQDQWRALGMAKSRNNLGGEFTERDADSHVELLDQAREFLDAMMRTIDSSTAGTGLPESQLSGRRSSFSSYQGTINQLESSLESKILAWKLSEQSTERLVDTTDDAIVEEVRQLEQSKVNLEAAHEELLKEKELKHEEIASISATFKNSLETTIQETDLKKSEIKTSGSLNKIEYESALLDIQFLKTELDQARDRHQASLELSTLDRLSRSNPLSDQEVRSLALQIEERRLAVDDTLIDLAKTELRSPVQGTVLGVNNLIGEYPSSTFATIATKGARYIEVFIEEEEVSNLAVGQEVLISLDAFPDKQFSEKVYYVSTSGERDANDIVKYQVLISLDTPVAGARSEMTINAEFVEEKLTNVIAIPLEYITKLDGKDVVYMQNDENEEGEVREVQLGIKDEENVHAAAGIKVGQEIVLPFREKAKN